MQKCLGIYIENNIIKYAKVSKERDDLKIESYGIRFFDSNLGAEIKRIVEETFSFNTPISINLSNEKYLYFDVFALLKKKDIEETVETEFETFCEEKKYNKNAFENRYALMENIQENEKLRAMDIYINKIELNRQIQALENFQLTNVVPTSIAIGNIAKVNKNENQLIVNMEESTIITTILNQKIYEVETLDIGSKEILDSINQIENSYAKAYEICKNTTLYTAEMENQGQDEYLQYIVPVIFEIAKKVQQLIDEGWKDIKKVYLTGTIATINNIDLYFQEFLPDIECEILKPKFLKETAKINIKEYIEVNSAIALAVNGLGEGIQEFNFQKLNTNAKLKKLLKAEIKLGKGNNGKLEFDLTGKLVGSEVWLVRGIIAIILILIIYVIFAGLLKNSMISKKDEIKGLTTQQNAQIAVVDSNSDSLTSKTQKYQSLISDLDEIDKKTSDIASSRNLIPNLLNQIMFIIPEKVQLISIENATSKNITIKAVSNDYEQLGYFIATIKTKGILKNVVSSSGNKSGDVVSVTIEGELP